MLTEIMPFLEAMIGTISWLAKTFSSLGSSGMFAVLMLVALLKIMNVAKVATLGMAIVQTKYNLAMLQSLPFHSLQNIAEMKSLAIKKSLMWAQMGLNLGMMSGMGALMAYASGAEALGHALTILTMAIIAVTVAIHAENIAMLLSISLKTLGIGTAVALAAFGVGMSYMGHQMAVEQQKFKSEMDVMKSEVPTYQHGLSHVPYTGFVASLHQGEGILTREENYDYRAGQMGGTQIFNIYDTNRQSIDELIARYGR
jgi:hypothetical protein